MRFLISCLLFFLPSFVLALNAPVNPGRYQFKDFSVTLKKRFEIVHAMTAQGKDRLKELQNNRYSCLYVTDEQYLCSTALPTQNTEHEISAQVEKEFSNVRLEFSEAQGEPELISSSDNLQEWKVPQKVQFNGQEHPTYRLFRSREFEKVFLGSPAQETFLLNEKKEVKFPSTLTVSESKNSYFLYFITSTFR